jgi:hypothetical protein
MGKISALVACECSGIMRDALIAEGVDAISCDLKPCERPGPHIQGDVLNHLWKPWDLLIGMPVCRFLANSGVRWLHSDITRWPKMFEGAEFFCKLDRAEHIPHRAIENSVMHRYARRLVGRESDQTVQPWWHGDPFFKGTSFWLTKLPPLVDTNRLTPPASGTDEWKAWSRVHRAPPGVDRETERSRTHPGIAAACAKQWVAHIRAQRAAPTFLHLMEAA